MFQAWLLRRDLHWGNRTTKRVSFWQTRPRDGQGVCHDMKRKRFSVEQIVTVVKQAETGLPVANLIRQRDPMEKRNER